MLTPTEMTAASKPTSTRGRPLTDRELEVLRGVSFGLPAKVLARQMGISHKTVDVHRGNLARKLGLKGVGALTRYYMTYIDPPRCRQCETVELFAGRVG